MLLLAGASKLRVREPSPAALPEVSRQQSDVTSVPAAIEAAEPTHPAAAAAVGGKRRNEGDAVAAARERYLARKKQHT